MTQKGGRVVSGEVAGLRRGSGAIERCPECRRKIINDHCVVHIEVDPVKDFRAMLEVDGKTIVVNGDKTEKITDLTTEEAHVLPEHELLRLMRGKLIGTEIRAFTNEIDREDNLLYASEIDVLEG